MNNLKKFLKKYGFYLALLVVCIGAVTAVFLLPNNKGNIAEQPNPYAENKAVAGSDAQDPIQEGDQQSGEYQIDITYDESVSEEAKEETNQQVAVSENSADKQNEESKVANEEKTETKEVAAKSFDETTASKLEKPFMADNDSIDFPVSGDIIVPYTDDSSRYWYSQALNQTMRTYGVCIGAAKDEPIKAVTHGIITDIIDDATTIDDGFITSFGKVIVLEAGNGYVFRYGVQGGTVNKDLLGKVVERGDVIAQVGKAQGAYANLGESVYLQLLHDGEVLDVTKFLDKN